MSGQLSAADADVDVVVVSRAGLEFGTVVRRLKNMSRLLVEDRVEVMEKSSTKRQSTQ